MTQEDGWPSEDQRDGSHNQTKEDIFTTVSDKIHAPVQGTKEGEDDGTIGDLHFLENVKVRGDGVVVHARQDIETWLSVMKKG